MLYYSNISVPSAAEEIPGNAVSHDRQTFGAPLNILLVEDLFSDAILTRIALDSTQLPYTLRIIQKGDEVLPYLSECVKNGENTLPDLMMLDLGMPRMDGFEILSELEVAPAVIRALPIIILTSHEHFEKVRETSHLWIPAYVNKPCNVEKMREMLTSILRVRSAKVRPH